MDAAKTYVSALFTVYIIIIFVRILLSFVRAFFDFIFQSTEWFLGFFRRLIPPLGMFDLSPIVAIIVLYILRDLALTLLDTL